LKRIAHFRHVHGHKGVVTPRNAVNTWCDSECRELMRLARGGLSPEASLEAMPG
jgi:hypothetical protein